MNARKKSAKSIPKMLKCSIYFVSLSADTFCACVCVPALHPCEGCKADGLAALPTEVTVGNQPLLHSAEFAARQGNTSEG